MSDRIYKVDMPCPETPENICWESCLTPGHNCQACSNTTFYECPKSKQCVHPQLRCDGHPQCEYGEDEDLDECYKDYQNNKVIGEYATFRCQSIMYPIMETYATACDNFPECFGELDEQFCSDSKLANIVLLSTVAAIAFLYLSLKIARTAYEAFQHRGTKENIVNKSKINKTEKTILDSFSDHHENAEVIKEMNSYLIHCIVTKSFDEVKKICQKVYKIEAKVHKNNKNEIFSCLHQKMDPSIMNIIVDSEFKGLTQKCIVLYCIYLHHDNYKPRI